MFIVEQFSLGQDQGRLARLSRDISGKFQKSSILPILINVKKEVRKLFAIFVYSAFLCKTNINLQERKIYGTTEIKKLLFPIYEEKTIYDKTTNQ